jgi:hypothetical protein
VRPIPEDFAEQLLRVLDPDDAEEAASLILRASELPEAELAEFLEVFAERLRAAEEPVRAAELRRWLDGPPGTAPPASSPRRS